MCTAIAYSCGDFYFGRNLDLYYHYEEQIAICPRNYPFAFRNGATRARHYALIGMATLFEGYPLFYEATNEKGLSMAGLNFPENAFYLPAQNGKENIAPFELIPRILGDCGSVTEAVAALGKINLWAIPFSKRFPLSPLHWLLADAERSVTIEPREDGLQIYENPVGILTNNPPFEYHLTRLCDFAALSPAQPSNRFCKKLNLSPYSLGMGTIGLPGDLSSSSRFIRAAFTKANALPAEKESARVGQFFHLLESVYQVKGLNQTESGEYEYTLYSCCCNATRGIYYYKTYENSRITALDLHRADLEGVAVQAFPLITEQQISFQN